MGFKKVLKGLVALLFFNVAQLQAQTSITILDQHNQPVKNAVIEIKLVNAEQKSAVAATSLVMDQVDKSFLPEVLIVPQHSSVSFPNSDDIRHHVYSFSPAKTFELKLYANQPKDPIVFDNEGIVVLGCNIHDAMVGYIYVTANRHTYLTNENGKIELPLSANELDAMHVWHANTSGEITTRKTFSTFRKEKEIMLQLTIQEAEKRDSFEDVFHHAQ